MAHLVMSGSPLVSANPMVAVNLQKHVFQHVQIDAVERAMRESGMEGQQQVPPEVQMQIDALAAVYMAEGMKAVQDMGRQLSGSAQPDPVVALKQQELQLDALAEQNDKEREERELNLKQAQMMDKSRQFDERIRSQEEQTAARIQAALERERMKDRSVQ